MEIKKNKLILFDLDGVLIDSEKNMRAAWQEVRSEFRIDTKFEEYRKFVGLPFFKVLKSLKIKKNLKKIKRIFDLGSINNVNLIKLYPNTKKTLKLLKKNNFKFGLVTSKDNYRTKMILKKLNLNFEYVVVLFHQKMVC